jgi:predicted metal-dependent peptidase
MKSNKKTIKKIKKCRGRWLSTLGLLWWEVRINYYTDASEIADRFNRLKDGRVVPATVTSDWRYGTATVSINVPAFRGKKKKEIEFILVHEFVHILVNEMRERGMKHEERVVTNLTTAFFWTANREFVRGA